MQQVSIFGVNYSVCDYESASQEIIDNAKQHRSYGVSALAVHGLMESFKDKSLMAQVNKLNLVVPDGQPVRWAMNAFHKTGLKERVYGPTLTLYVLKKANNNGLGVYLYGSKKETLDKLQDFIKREYPNVIISGVHIDRFREATEEEDLQDIKKINESGANIVLVGRGCPRQEKWVANHLGKINAAMMAVGAAFDFHAGTVEQAPAWMQRSGLEWLFRLTREPKRLWKRYLFTNSLFIYLFIKKSLKFKV